jgi:hypothetical protein
MSFCSGVSGPPNSRHSGGSRNTRRASTARGWAATGRVVERTFAWLHNRRLLIRSDRRDDIHEGFLALAWAKVMYFDIGDLDGSTPGDVIATVVQAVHEFFVACHLDDISDQWSHSFTTVTYRDAEAAPSKPPTSSRAPPTGLATGCDTRER